MIYNFQHTRTIYAGDIHGEFRTLIFELNRFKISDALVIVLCDIGMGFHKHNYYVNEFNKISKKLKKQNNTVLFFRGNHDSPKYFETDLFNNKYDNIILANDYDIINQNNIKSLIIGGAISIDRIDRPIEYYWENENIHYNDIDKGKIKNLKDISIILSHAAPLNVWPFDKPGLEYYKYYDKLLESDENNSRKLLSNIYNDLINQGNNIKKWYHGHYHRNHHEINNEIEYRCINMNEIYETTKM